MARTKKALRAVAVAAGICMGLLAEAAADPPGTITYQYDALGRLVKVVRSDGTYVEYAYDAADNRVTVHAVGTPLKVIVLPLSGFVVIPIKP